MFAFTEDRPRRRPSLTPMIDVVFLLLVFFMLAARFGTDTELPLQIAGHGGAAYSGPPRLVGIAPDGLKLNGVAMAQADLIAQLHDLTKTPGDLIVLRPLDGASLQAIVAAMDALKSSGFTDLVLVE
ncbi:biopolymer transporter ExbD [Thioclava sp. BHET1]|nr:biopolymer transporter ExbD [Thioclava sp. BHET1]